MDLFVGRWAQLTRAVRLFGGPSILAWLSGRVRVKIPQRVTFVTRSDYKSPMQGNWTVVL
jgi:hypothetical protein